MYCYRTPVSISTTTGAPGHNESATRSSGCRTSARGAPGSGPAFAGATSNILPLASTSIDFNQLLEDVARQFVNRIVERGKALYQEEKTKAMLLRDSIYTSHYPLRKGALRLEIAARIRGSIESMITVIHGLLATVLTVAAFAQAQPDQPVSVVQIGGRIVDPAGAPFTDRTVTFSNWLRPGADSRAMCKQTSEERLPFPLRGASHIR